MRLIASWLLLVAVASAAYPSVDQYSQARDHGDDLSNDYRSVNNASDLRELMRSWGMDTRVPPRRGDIEPKIEQTEQDAKRGDVPRRKRMAATRWGYGEDEGLLMSDEPSYTSGSERKHRPDSDRQFWDRRRNDEERAMMQEMRRKQWEQQESRRTQALRRSDEQVSSRQSEETQQPQPQPQPQPGRRRQRPPQQSNRPEDHMSYQERLANWQREKDEYEKRYARGPSSASSSRPEVATSTEMDPRVQDYIRRNTAVDLRANNNQPAKLSRRPLSSETKRRQEEQKRRQEELKRRDDEQKRRDDELKARDDELKNREEELKRRAEEQGRRDEEQSRRDEEMRRRMEEQVRRDEEERRRAPVDDGEHKQEEFKQAQERRMMRLPVSARILIRNETSNPLLSLRQRPESTIDFTGRKSHGEVSSTSSERQRGVGEVEATSPSHCVWAIVVCCRAHAGRSVSKLGRCFEATECLAVPWDEAACEPAKVTAANDEIRRFYLQSS